MDLENRKARCRLRRRAFIDQECSTLSAELLIKASLSCFSLQHALVGCGFNATAISSVFTSGIGRGVVLLLSTSHSFCRSEFNMQATTSQFFRALILILHVLPSFVSKRTKFSLVSSWSPMSSTEQTRPFLVWTSENLEILLLSTGIPAGTSMKIIFHSSDVE